MANLIKVKSSKMHAICVEYLDKEQAKVLAMQEDNIQKEMKPRFFGLLKGKSREEVTKNMVGNEGRGKYWLAKLSGCIEVETADNLRQLCLLNMEGDVLVDDFTASILKVKGESIELKKEL